ncbi:oxidoreductase [Roseofilum casamattae]|uniref:Oxidoreductase n=1 Tax=Roseofilum casamattae BLCC-M143 TaxID=3022442 RepID=A0ABT7BWV2_9CYAN|nr:oxidoreductase [Roseofilum casamattae]MDJ1183677.1 oxidoreductase [Roseofilum casamattae BLCC-M143]
MNARISNSGFSDWTPDKLPNLSGKTYLITGGNSGIGLEAAKMLAKVNANLIIGCRSTGKAERAVAELAAIGSGTVDYILVDLSKMSSVRSAAADIQKRDVALDGLIANAGIMQTPETRTEDGFELQLATNHLGHFLLSGLLFDRVEQASGRIVVVSSIAHKFGAIAFDDLMLTQDYDSSRAYGQSKLANLLFAFELQRRLEAAGSSVSCYACHPGYSATQLQSTGPKGFWNVLYKLTNAIMAQPAYNGAIPTVLAAAGAEAVPGAYYGPQSMMEARGRVSDATVAPQALDEEVAARLWGESEKLVGYEWTLRSPTPAS